MQRRKFIRKIAGAGVVATTAVAAPAIHAKQRFNWKLVTTWPPNFPIFQEGVERFAREVRIMSGGQMNISVFAGGQLVPPLGVFDAVSQGTAVQMGHGAAYYWIGKIPAAAFFTAVPFGMNAQGMNAWYYGGDGLKLWREAYKPHNLVPFPMGNTGVQMGGWFRKKINTVDDLKGLKMRIPGLGGKVMAKAGVNAVNIAGGEIYTALERGTIEATEWVGPYHDLRLGLYRAAKYYYSPGWHEPGPTLELTVNSKAWASLPKELKLIIESAAAASNVWMLSQFEARNLEALHTLQSRYKVKTYEFPKPVLQHLKKMTDVVLKEEAAKDKTFAKVWKEYEKFRKGNDAWSALSEAAYARTKNL